MTGRPAGVGTAAIVGAACLLLAGLSPAAEETPHARVELLIGQDLWIEAVESARALVEADPADSAARGLLARSLFRAGRLVEVQRLLESVATDPDPAPSELLTQARLRAAQGRAVEATELAGRALRLAPDDRDILYWSADLSADRREAASRIERYLEISEGDDPDRIEAARGALRLYRALDDRPVWLHTSRPTRAEIPLNLIWDDTGKKLGYVVRAEIGPKRRKVRLLLDTGSTGLFLVDRKARKCGFQPLTEETAFGGGGKRRHVSRRGLFPHFGVGELHFRDALAGTTRTELEPHGRYHGVLGVSIFDGYRVTLDLVEEKLVLEPAGPLAGGAFYWTVAGQMLVEASVASDVSGLFLFDTGAHWSVVSYDLAAQVEGARLTPIGDVRGFGGQVEGASLLRGVEVRFEVWSSGGENLRALDLSLRSRVGGVEISGFLGMDLLDRSRIVIDTVDRRVRVAKRE